MVKADAIATPPSEQDKQAIDQVLEIVKTLSRDGQRRVLMCACAFFDVKLTIE